MNDDTVRVWDIQTGRELRSWNSKQGTVYSVAFSPDGRLIVTGGSNRDVKMWATETGLEQTISTRQLRASMVVAAFLPDGRVLAVPTGMNRVEVARLPGVEVIAAVDLPERMEAAAAAFSADGRLVALGAGSAVWLWRVGDVGSGASQGQSR